MRMMLLPLLFVLTAYACLASIAQQLLHTPSSPSTHPTSTSNKNIFILAGQSNMVGLGGVVSHVWDGFIPRECTPDPSILRLSVNLTWVEAREPLHADIDAEYACGIGPGMPFAKAVLGKEAGIRVVGLVPCAIGGTRISQWESGTRFYAEMVKRAKASLREGGTIRAVLWYQGESDTEIQKDAESYKGRFEEFVRDLRSDLQSSTLPVIQVALASGTGPSVDTVRAAQLGTNMTNVRCVDAKGLPLESDRLHLSAAAQVQLGEKMGQAFLQTWSSPHQKGTISTTSSSTSASGSCSYFMSHILLDPLTRFLLTILIVSLTTF